ncbi:AEC family transporter [Celeribacter sp.]|uniref:AEC family transporter n=1 Tax=Celeribacter sp. TaxID=1890673 RepID=UPI003A9138FD
MQALFEVILPVFLVIGFGYLAAWRKWISENAIDGVMHFAQNFAVPTLLFTGIAGIDLGETFHPPLLLSFYAGAFSGGLFAFLGARYVFKRTATDSIAIGFVGLFSNGVLLGVPITERAFGTDALAWNFAIISLHAPILYAVGITLMEVVRSTGQGLSALSLIRQITTSVLRNPLILGITAGWFVNVTDTSLPTTVWDAVHMMNSAAIPAALFGLGGVLRRYRPEGDMRMIVWAITASLIVHPLVTFSLAKWVFALDTNAMRSATVMAAMAPGVNAYLFASMYGVAKRVAASAVLLGTAMAMVTGWFWLSVLP